MSSYPSVPSSLQHKTTLPPGLPLAPLDGGARRETRVSRDAALVLLVAVGYYAGTKIGFALTPSDDPIAVFWPPNAILLAAFLLAPVQLWWAFLLALIPAHLLAQLPSGVPVATSLGWLVGNTGEALLGAVLISRLRGSDALFHGIRGVTRFLLFGFILAPLVTSFLDAAVVVGTQWGRDYWVLWTTRLFSNMLAQLTIVPTLVVFAQWGISGIRKAPRQLLVEAALLSVAVVLVSLLVFRAETLLRTSIPALIYLPLPLLLWAAVRFGPAGLSASLLTISIVSIHSVMHGRGPFISTSVAASVLSMQVFLCMIGVPLLLLAAVTMEQRKTEESLRDTSRRLIDSQERERQRIAQELHDDIGQRLVLAEIELDGIIAKELDQSPGGRLNGLRDQVGNISRATWEISHGLYPSNLEYLGLVRAVKRLCSDLGQDMPLKLHCETSRIPDHLPADVALCLYRVTQEALQNVVRHSQATTASVELWVQGGRLLLRVVDDGVGFSQPPKESGLGLASMRERLKSVDGGVEIDSAPGRGTRLDAWVMLRGKTSEAV